MDTIKHSTSTKSMWQKDQFSTPHLSTSCWLCFLWVITFNSSSAGFAHPQIPSAWDSVYHLVGILQLEVKY